jgi:hypothetical protein
MTIKKDMQGKREGPKLPRYSFSVQVGGLQYLLNTLPAASGLVSSKSCRKIGIADAGSQMPKEMDERRVDSPDRGVQQVRAEQQFDKGIEISLNEGPFGKLRVQLHAGNIIVLGDIGGQPEPSAATATSRPGIGIQVAYHLKRWMERKPVRTALRMGFGARRHAFSPNLRVV